MGIMENFLPFTDDVMVVLVHKCVQQTQLLALHLETLGYIPRLLNALNGLVVFNSTARYLGDLLNMDDHYFNGNQFLTVRLLKQFNRYYKLRRATSKFYHKHRELIYNIGLKLLQQAILEPVFYGDLAHKYKRIVGIQKDRKRL